MNLWKFLLFFIGSFLCLYLVFSSTATVPYVRHDSIRYFHKFYNTENGALTNPQYHWLGSLGRPVTAEIEEFIYKRINNLSDMSYLRFVVIVVFALSAALLATIIVSHGFGTVEAFCISVAIFTLPGIQECIFVPFLPLALPVLLSISAYVFLTSRLISWVRFTLAFILLEISFFTYASSTFFFLIPTAFLVILQDKDRQGTGKTWVRDMLLWVLAAVVYYFSLKIFFYDKLKSSGHEIDFSWGDTLRNIKMFLPVGVPQSFNLWNIYYSKTIGLMLMIFAGSVLTIDYFTRGNGRGQRIFAIGGIFLILNLVWFLFFGYLPRTFMASQALVLILLYWCVKWVIHAWNKNNMVYSVCWPISFMLVGLLNANITTIRNVYNSNSELMFIRSRLVQNADSSTKEIHVIRPKDGAKGYNGLPCVYDNFNCTSMSDYEIPDFIRVALKDINDPPTEMHFIVTSSSDGEPLMFSPFTVIIDMNDLVAISKIKSK